MNCFIDDTINDTQRVEVKFNTVDSSIDNLLVLLVEVVEERRPVVTSIALSPQAEVLGLDRAVQLWKSTQESLHNFPGSVGSKLGGV